MDKEQAVEMIRDREILSRKFEKALRIASIALEKQIPKKPEERDSMLLRKLYCANCGYCFGSYGDLYIPTNSKFCCECGQAIDWKEVRDD